MSRMPSSPRICSRRRELWAKGQRGLGSQDPACFCASGAWQELRASVGPVPTGPADAPDKGRGWRGWRRLVSCHRPPQAQQRGQAPGSEGPSHGAGRVGGKDEQEGSVGGSLTSSAAGTCWNWGRFLLRTCLRQANPWGSPSRVRPIRWCCEPAPQGCAAAWAARVAKGSEEGWQGRGGRAEQGRRQQGLKPGSVGQAAGHPGRSWGCRCKVS